MSSTSFARMYSVRSFLSFVSRLRMLREMMDGSAGQERGSHAFAR